VRDTRQTPRVVERDEPTRTTTLELVPSDPRWPQQFTEVRAVLLDVFGDDALRVEHIGSTAVPGLLAKPTIDVLVVVADTDAALDRVPLLAEHGFDHRPSAWPDPARHVFFQRVIDGRRTHHLHVVPDGSHEIDDYLAIRDYLRAHPAEVDAYGTQKLSLLRAHDGDRAAYVAAKPAFVEQLLARATSWTEGRP